jgi:aspartate-semialdehyde dehydrogenase
VFHTINAVGEFSEEEIKMQRETRRILHLPELRIAVTCVRVPTLGGHGESMAIETESPIDPNVLRSELATVPNVVVDDDPANGRYPMPVLTDGSDMIHVGRIRRDDSVDNGVLLWIVADNLRVGAATNAVRIAELFLPVSTPSA